ncbi:MAG: hypothetical protein AAB388_03890 [Patescibacteria group bacterium]
MKQRDNSSVLGLNRQDQKLAASGAGVIVFNQKDDYIKVLLARRSKKVGAGLGITGGGFAQCDEIDQQPVGTIIYTADEAYRETCEENAGFAEIISADDFLERAQPVTLIHVRVADDNRVHVASFFALRVTDIEWDAMKQLRPGGDDERAGPLLESLVRWDQNITRRQPERYVSIELVTGEVVGMADFWHKHEVRAIASIAWHAQHKRLW